MSRSLLPLLCVGLLSLALPCGVVAAPTDPLPDILKTIDGGEIRALAQELAGPAYRGRMTGEPGLFSAVERIEGLWSAWGIQKVDPATWRQPFTVLSSRVIGLSSCTLTLPDGTVREFVDTTDYQPFPYGGATPVSGEVVFAGYGISAPDLGYDDYANLDVTGKIAFVMRHAPNHEMDRFGDHATFVSKAKAAHAHGAVGIVVVTDPNGHEDFTPLDFPNAAINLGEGFAAIYLHTQYAQEWLAPSGQVLASLQTAIDTSGQPLSFPMGVSAALEVPTAFAPEQPTVNVVGWLEGSDPKKKHEVIVIGAHLDHLGYRGDRIYPGADDNCSGTVALLSIAQAFATAKTRPDRSVLFIHFSGEEMGLLGSEHYVKQPLVPQGRKIVAMLNMDMVGLGNGNVTTLVPKEGNSDRLTQLVAPAKDKYLAGEAPWVLNYGVAQYNSDHGPFAKAGIPALFFVSSGDHPDYHQPGDTPEKLDASILERCARLCAAVGWTIAERGVPAQALAWTPTDHRRYHAHDEES